MATGRIIKKQISYSEQVNALTLKSALLFTWLIPWVDDFGRLEGSPAKVKAIVVPMRPDFSNKDVEKCLKELHENDLIHLYEVDQKPYLQIKNFDVHQSGLHRRTASKFPCPNYQEIQGTVGNFPEIQGRTRTIYKKIKTRARGMKTALPPDFEITPDIVQWAKEKGLPDPYSEIEKFKSHNERDANEYVNWKAAFRNWLIKAAEFAKERKENSHAQNHQRTNGSRYKPSGAQAFNEFLTGDPDAPPEKDITEFTERVS